MWVRLCPGNKWAESKQCQVYLTNKWSQRDQNRGNTEQWSFVQGLFQTKWDGQIDNLDTSLLQQWTNLKPSNFNITLASLSCLGWIFFSDSFRLDFILVELTKYEDSTETLPFNNQPQSSAVELLNLSTFPTSSGKHLWGAEPDRNSSHHWQKTERL